MARVWLVLLVMGATGLSLAAQQSAPAFEVASVKPNTTDAEPSMNVPPRGSVAIVNVPLENVIVNPLRVVWI